MRSSASTSSTLLPTLPARELPQRHGRSRFPKRGDQDGQLNEVNRLQSKIALEINSELVGRTCPVLLDDFAPRGEGLLQGRTPSDKVVLVEAGEEMLGRMVSVGITGAENWCLSGRILGTAE